MDEHFTVLSTLSSPPSVFILINLQGSHKILLGARTSVSNSLVLNWAQKEEAASTEGAGECLMWWKTGELVSRAWSVLENPHHTQ